MPIYILLSRLSQQGVATLKSNPDRLREVNRDVEELGARVSVALGARGSTKIQTLPALTIDEFVATLAG